MTSRSRFALAVLAATAALWTVPPARAQQPPPVQALAFQNTALSDAIKQLARQSHLTYTLDPAVKVDVSVSTYGDTSRLSASNMDARTLLDLILRVNNAAIKQEGGSYRIVPSEDRTRIPLRPPTATRNIPADDQVVLDLVFLKNAKAEDLAKTPDQFKGENAAVFPYSPANLLLIQDTRRNMRRTMEMIARLDTDSTASQRARTDPAAGRAPGKDDSPLGADMGGGFRGCVTGDNSPNGTVRDGYKKSMTQTPFGPSCSWEKVK